MAKREWFPRQRDALQRHRNLITYLLVVLGLLGARVGWGLLPDMVTIRPPTAANHHYVPKAQGLLLNLAMTEIFAALFWRWPREWVYLAGSLIGLLFTFALLYNNLV